MIVIAGLKADVLEDPKADTSEFVTKAEVNSFSLKWKLIS